MELVVMRKSQTEIVGVAMIVIILVFGGLVYMSLKNRSRAEISAEDFLNPEIAQTMLNVLMNIKTEKNIIVSDIIKDCFSYRNDLCGSEVDCCLYARDVIDNALSETLEKWGKSYVLKIRKGELKKIPDIPENSPCKEDSEKYQPGFYYIPSSPLIIVRLDICK